MKLFVRMSLHQILLFWAYQELFKLALYTTLLNAYSFLSSFPFFDKKFAALCRGKTGEPRGKWETLLTISFAPYFIFDFGLWFITNLSFHSILARNREESLKLRKVGIIFWDLVRNRIKAREREDLKSYDIYVRDFNVCRKNLNCYESSLW